MNGIVFCEETDAGKPHPKRSANGAEKHILYTKAGVSNNFNYDDHLSDDMLNIQYHNSNTTYEEYTKTIRFTKLRSGFIFPRNHLIFD